MGAFDGNGNFVRSYSWAQDKANSLDITASRMDTEDNGFAAGLSNCVTRDGQGRIAADLLPATDLGAALGSASFRWNGFNGKSIDHILPQSAFKAATLARINNLTPTADPDLTIPVPAPGTYVLDMLLGVTGTGGSGQGFRFALYSGGLTFAFTTPGVKVSWIFPVSSSVGGFVSMTSTPTAVFTSLTDIGATSGQMLHLKGAFIATAVSGAFLQLYWSQNTSSPIATSILAGSYMSLMRID